MNLTIQIPDELARDLIASGGDLSRRALEGFALEEYKSGRLTKPALRRFLGFSTLDQMDMDSSRRMPLSRICRQLRISNLSARTCKTLGLL